jgi:hypothetical protein
MPDIITIFSLAIPNVGHYFLNLRKNGIISATRAPAYFLVSNKIFGGQWGCNRSITHGYSCISGKFIKYPLRKSILTPFIIYQKRKRQRNRTFNIKLPLYEKILSPFIPVLIVISLSAQSTKEPVKVTDMLKIKSITGVTLSNDGSKAAFTVTSIEPDGDTKWEYKYVNQVWMLATDAIQLQNSLPIKKVHPNQHGVLMESN